MIRTKLMQSNRSILIAVAILAAVLGACASSGGGDAAAPAAAAAAAKPDYSQEVGDNGLPTPRALAARFIEATGGEDALRAVEHTTMKGKMLMPAMGMQGDLVLYAQAPNRMSMNVEMAGIGSINSGFNGEHGWSDNPMTGPQLLSGDMLEEMKTQADFFSQFNLEENYPTRETLEEVEFEGKAAYKVRLVDTRDKETIQYYEKETGYLIGTEGTQSSEMGEMKIETVIGDYQTYGTIVLPASTTLKMIDMGMEIQQKVEEVSFEPIPDEKFTPPESIQALIDSQ